MQAVRNDLAKAEKSAERFFGALRDVFVGAPVRQRIMAKSEEKDEGERQKDKVRDLSLIASPFAFSADVVGEIVRQSKVEFSYDEE